MAIFNPFKKISERVRIMAEENERIARYSSLSTDKLRELEEHELIPAADARINSILREKNELMRAVLELKPEQRTFYFVRNYETQLDGGGIWQYFADSSRRNVPYLPEALTEIGAAEHRALFQSFTEANHIDLNDPINFSTFDLRKFEENGSTVFSVYDREYRRLPPLSDYLAAYIRQNIDAF